MTATQPSEAPATSDAQFIRIEGISKKFGEFTAVDNISLNIGKGELFALLGGSGCGKTTLLRILAGFETPSAGRIYIDGQDMTGVAPYDRPVNMMFQSYALFPHMSVEKNVAYGLKHDGWSASEAKERVREMLELVQLGQLAGRKPHQISGGQRQRVALARALAKQPKVLLLDEPLGALDKKLREHTQFELMNIQYKTGITFIVVTHDQEEAMTLASRVAVMDKGLIRQIGSATEVYENPNSRFVADFIGSINLFEGTVLAVDNNTARLDVPALGQTVLARADKKSSAGDKVTVAVRPEKFVVTRQKPEAVSNAVQGVVNDLAYFGKDSLYRIQLETGTVLSINVVNARRAGENERIAQWDDKVWLSFDQSSVILLAE